MQRLTVLCFVFSLMFASSSWAQSPSSDGSPSPAPATTPPAAAHLDPANPGAFDAAAATQAWLDTVPADKRAKSDAYFEGTYWITLWSALISAAILYFFLRSR